MSNVSFRLASPKLRTSGDRVEESDHGGSDIVESDTEFVVEGIEGSHRAEPSGSGSQSRSDVLKALKDLKKKDTDDKKKSNESLFETRYLEQERLIVSRDGTM